MLAQLFPILNKLYSILQLYKSIRYVAMTIHLHLSLSAYDRFLLTTEAAVLPSLYCSVVKLDCSRLKSLPRRGNHQVQLIFTLLTLRLPEIHPLSALTRIPHHLCHVNNPLSSSFNNLEHAITRKMKICARSDRVPFPPSSLCLTAHTETELPESGTKPSLINSEWR